jgi:hypothetical protein
MTANQVNNGYPALLRLRRSTLDTRRVEAVVSRSHILFTSIPSALRSTPGTQRGQSLTVRIEHTFSTCEEPSYVGGVTWSLLCESLGAM